VFTWGKGNRGQLGNGDTDSLSSPTRVKFGREFKDMVVSVCAGFNHTAALTANGSVYLWGKGMSERIKVDERKSCKPRAYNSINVIHVLWPLEASFCLPWP
jgi:alpha-tubulin suppressor-like RCC1 family protein